MMKQHFLIILATSLISDYAQANDWTFKSGLNIGSRTIRFNQDFDQGALSVAGFSTKPAHRTAEFNQTFRSADLTGTVNWSNLYITANYETNLDAENGVVQTSYTDATSNSSSDHAFDFTRHDYAINLGWNAFDSFSIFTGYKYGETDSNRDATFGIVGSPKGTVASSFQEAGPFVGASYSWVFTPGVLTLSAAYADMTGNYEEAGDEFIYANMITPTHVKAVVQNAMQYEGHTNGFSANLSWNVLSGEHYAYYLAARWQHYEFSADTDITWKFYDVDTSVPSMTVIPLHGSGKVKNSETISALYAGINYLF